ncbi:MAG: hypothetical protein ABW198_08575 [Pseudorhodoplanes sp.]
MTYPRYVVFDDAPENPGKGWTADQIAEALRAPLAAIGVRVVRQSGAKSNSPSAGLQAHGTSRQRFLLTLNKVDGIVNDVFGKVPRPI